MACIEGDDLSWRFIMSKEVIESAPEEGVNEYIGAGLFKFIEWQVVNLFITTRKKRRKCLEKPIITEKRSKL